AEVNRALDLVAGEPYFLNNRGFIHLEMNQPDKAIEDINRSIVLNPKNGWAYRNKGIWKMNRGELEEALGLFERALRTGEFIDEIFYYQGLVYRAKNLMPVKRGVKVWEIRRSQASECLLRIVSDPF
ncbi:MAG: tetratricopeptide repeat protein, partial [Ekhidna sp.]|nr:tetratricopeptide repeat protein [Ekhidna sp.]